MHICHVAAQRRVLASLLSLVVVGCTTMKVSETKVQATESYQLKAEYEGLLVAAYPVTNKDEIEESFRTDLLGNGILPVLVIAENRSPSTSFLIAKEKVAVVDQDSLRKTSANREIAASDKGGESLLNIGGVLFSPVLLITGSKMASDAQVINHNLADKAFYSRTVGPGQKVHGYVYFQLPQGSAAVARHHVLVEVSDASTGKTVTFDFPFSFNRR
jgi:hypothetical protein